MAPLEPLAPSTKKYDKEDKIRGLGITRDELVLVHPLVVGEHPQPNNKYRTSVHNQQHREVVK